MNLYFQLQWAGVIIQRGPFRELNPRPPAPKAGIIPLDQTAGDLLAVYTQVSPNSVLVCMHGKASPPRVWMKLQHVYEDGTQVW